MRDLSNSGRLRMPSGVPIKTVVLLRTINDPIVIETPGKPTRIFLGGNNHHMEILEDEKTGQWSGQCWDTFTVTRRIRPPKGMPKLPMVIGRELDRLRDERLLPDELEPVYRNKCFVMSLAEGEIIHARRRDRNADAVDAVGFFVVVKIDKGRNRVHFAPHWDAASADEQDRWDVSPTGLKNLGPKTGVSPYKVVVDPIGAWHRIDD